MLDLHVTSSAPVSGHLRLDTLVRLRWLAVIGQSGGALVVHVGLGYPLPLAACFLVITLSAALNIGLRIRYPMSHRLGDTAASILLAFDLFQLAALLFLTGGLQNPFAILFLAPVMISATALPPGRTLILGGLAVALSGALIVWHWPLPWDGTGGLDLPFLYVLGIWCALVVALAFIAIYAWRVAQEARALVAALTATELVLAREQHLSQIDGLAAAAAHELGTPLSTIVLIAKELRGLVPAEGPLAEDVALLNEEAARCRDILAKITSLGDGDAGPLGVLSISHLLEEAADAPRPFGGAVLRRDMSGEGREPVCRRNPGMIYGIANLVDNALDFAREAVTLQAAWDAQDVRLTIQDDGPGFAPEVLMRLGEPYVTTRGRRRRDEGASGTEVPGSGLGLGLFIAKTLLERTGASVAFANAPAPAGGAIVTLTWPRAVFEA